MKVIVINEKGAFKHLNLRTLEELWSSVSEESLVLFWGPVSEVVNTDGEGVSVLSILLTESFSGGDVLVVSELELLLGAV